MTWTTGLEPAPSAVTVLRFEVFQRLTNPWERLRPPKSRKTVHFVDRIVDRKPSWRIQGATATFPKREIDAKDEELPAP